MSKKFQLRVPEPCHENWNKMTPVDKGRFCDSCQKAVVDFTGMSDAQLIAYFKKPSAGSVCGRFYNDQLERDFDMQRKRLPWLKYFFQFAIPVFLTGFKSYSQGKPMLKENIVSVCADTSADKVILGSLIPLTRSKIKGKVIDEDGQGIPYATVVIKGTKGGTISDSNGIFQLENPADEKKITITASCVGYTAAEKQINLRRNDFTEVTLTTNTFLSGEVVVTSTMCRTNRIKMGGAVSVKVERSYIQRVKDYFIRDSLNVYPNPVKAGNEIKIGWEKTDIADHSIDLYNLQGQLIRSVSTEIGATTTINFRLPFVTPGTYMLRLTNKKTGKKYTEKIIIQ